MGLKEWVFVLTSSLLIFIIVEIEKKISRKYLQPGQQPNSDRETS
jgi:hypothetical protein